MNNEKIIIKISKQVKLVVEKNVFPYDKEVGIFLEKKDESGNFVFHQDIARISPSEEVDEKGNLNFSDELISVKVYENSEDEDFTSEMVFPIR